MNWSVHIRYRTVRGALRDFRVVVRANGAEAALADARAQLARKRPHATVRDTYTQAIREAA